MTERSSYQTPQFKCDMCSIQGASYKGVKHHTRMKQKNNWMDKVIAMLMNANLQRLSVQMIKIRRLMEKEITLKCEDCEYTTKEELLTNYTTSVQSVA